MNGQRPEHFDRFLILDALEHNTDPTLEFFFNTDFAVLHGPGTSLFNYFFNRKVPLLINDYRMGLVTRGEIFGRINLIERHITAGTMAFVGPGSIVEPISVSPDLQIKGVALFNDLPFTVGKVPVLFNGSVRDFQIQVETSQQVIISQFIESLWLMVHASPLCREAFDDQVAALMHYYNHLFSLDAERKVSPSHVTDIFNRFIQLVNNHVRREHKLGYYADRMCLTQRYLGSVVREVSGATAKEWIDRALVTEAKVMLKHSDKSVAQIADELHFPSPSFFSKYFRRLTGFTPAEYRLGK
ncbi:MAG: AraC family transcriptional regulator [Prevotella sp.]|nr:AraC family transcriptional regulator [Prevotella sp.]